MTFEDIKKANETIVTMGIERFNKKTGQAEIKEYAEVNQRIKAFRMVFPDGFILTEIDSLAGGVCLMTARVGYYDDGNTVVLGIGHAYEKEGSSNINKTSYIENCETSAVGRALGMCGFGIDTSVASYEEVRNAILNQDVVEPEPMLKDQKVQQTNVDALMMLANEVGSDISKILATYNVSSLKGMTMGQWKDCMEILTRRKDAKHSAEN